jgi:hypothetical protein
MGVSNWNVKAVFTATEDLNTEGHEGVAVALVDGKVANDGQEATGILYDKPQNGQNGSMIILGIGKGRAGGALTAGQRVTVSTSGYFTAAASGDYHCGRAFEAITSGSLGPIFIHGAGYYQVSSK